MHVRYALDVSRETAKQRRIATKSIPGDTTGERTAKYFDEKIWPYHMEYMNHATFPTPLVAFIDGEQPKDVVMDQVLSSPHLNVLLEAPKQSITPPLAATVAPMRIWNDPFIGGGR